MKTIHKATLIALLATATLSGTAHAGVTGESSNSDYANVGASTVNGGPHSAGKPGIGVPSTGLDNLVDFAGLTAYSSSSNGVYTLNYPSTVPSDHTGLGVFHFAAVSGANVYFGEWSQTTSANDGTHTVYYVGDDTGTTVPTSGSATYTVKGISDLSTNGALAGTFTANFASGSSGTLTGSLASATTGYTVDIGTASISGANISGTNASASQSGATLASSGTVSGQFYGSNAAALAGIVSFGATSRYNTAFGGTRN